MQIQTYRIYHGMVWRPIVIVLVLGALFVATGTSLYPGYADIMWISGGIVIALWIIAELPMWTYAITIEGDTLRERGWLSLKRSMDMHDIHTIGRSDFMLHRAAFDQLHTRVLGGILHITYWLFVLYSFLSRHPYAPMYTPMLRFREGVRGDFPMFPINPRIISAVRKVNPSVSIDADLVDLLPHSVRKELGVHLRWTDMVGLWIWRFLLAVLFLITGTIAVLVLMSFLGLHF